MCVSGAALILGGTSTGLNVLGAYNQSKTAQSVAQQQADIANYNRQLAMQQEQRIRQESEVEKLEHSRRVKQARGANLASAAERGIALGDVGSSIEQQQADITAEGQYDIMKIRDDAELRIRDTRIRAQGHAQTANLYRTKASGYNPLLDAVGTGAGGASSLLQYSSMIE